MKCSFVRGAFLVSCLYTAAAFAHGGIPNAHTAVAGQGTPDELWVETTFGLLVRKDANAQWRWICEEAVGYTGHAALHVMSSGRIFAAASNGLRVSDDGGCGWTENPFFAAASPSDIQAHPTTPSTLYVTTSTYQQTNALFRSIDSGATFQPTTLATSSLFLSAVRIAPSNPQRFYVSGWSLQGDGEVVLYRSDDGANAFTAQNVEAALGRLGVFTIHAVHPQNPDVLYASLESVETPQLHYLYRSDDAGQSFAQVVESSGPFSSVTVSEDGASVFAASESGLWRSTDAGQTFAERPRPDKNACVLRVGAVLYACGSQLQDGYAFARSDDDGETFTPLIRLHEIAGPLECPAGTQTQDVCPAIWPAQQAEFPKPSSDGGTGTDGGTTEPPPPNGCGCGTSGASLSFGVLVFALALLWRGRRVSIQPLNA